MAKTHKILALAGDGIGPEVMRETLRLMDWLSAAGIVRFEVENDLVGGAAFEARGTPLADETLALAHASDAVMFGAIGGPAWDTDAVPYELKPERGLLRLRKEMGLFANLRPALCFGALTDASSLRPEIIGGLDILIVRELIGGIYFGSPRDIIDLPDGGRKGFDTLEYSTHEIQRVARVAFDMAAQRSGRVCSVDKANVLKASILWRDEVTKLQAGEYPDVTLSHMYVDNAAMQMVQAPKQFDVLLTGNMFGDILSDLASMCTGSIGMLPSASLGTRLADGRVPSMFEPCHGSAPDIAGEDKANPLATILSLAMALRYSLDEGATADLIEGAVEDVLDAGFRTVDIMQPGKSLVSTTGMGDALMTAMTKRTD